MPSNTDINERFWNITQHIEVGGQSVGTLIWWTLADCSVAITNKGNNSTIKLCWAFFRNCRHARINIWPHSSFHWARKMLCQINSGRDTEAKTSPRHLNFLKQLNKTTELLYPYISGFKIHQGTQWVPRNTVAEQICHITIRNFGLASGPRYF